MVKTTNPALQAKLDQLVAYGNEDKVEEFVRLFVPSDLTEDELKDYMSRLVCENKAEWINLKDEIAAIAQGESVNRITGDQTTNATFFFKHPTLRNCDREVVFVCTDGDWRAEG
mmetsp:Transcript_10983/g.17260  ORF Transcript_10983/g.17260 Transcript_10983/m.17260 type:complete len:114 (+) Transcript_10983:181-522(+)|eukprot:CAMPEP_0184292038 /NCGR_PEP_ID=MMETSP1049-20130417/3898_1 /TAXON_ID=77928 /ORGANISM="Proteomonas sulcata, Strain CCMP704" /LENGTH=113 /DNA_ID=CAMNT_0026599665 /DNA_START=229 /DNA_END=570 /DNA_ORIENTATION=-